MENPKIDKLFQSSGRLLTIIGLWPLTYYDLKSPWVYFVRFHSWLMYICILFSTTGEVLYPILTEVNLIEVTENLGDIFGSLMAVFQLSIILWNRRDLYSLIKSAHTVRSKMVKEADGDLQTLETNSHKEASIVTLIMLVLIGGTISSYNIIFLYNFIVEEEHSYMLTFNMAYPFDLKRPIIYEFILIIQFIACVNFICIFCGIPSLFAALVIFACCQFKILQMGLKQLAEINNAKKDSHLKYLKRCIIHQQEIYTFCIHLESIYSPCIFVQFVLSGATLSLVAFQVTLKDIDIGKKLLLIQFFCLIVGTLFVYCWYGEQIATLSKSIAYSSYDTHWYNRTKEFKSLILQMVLRSQKPVYLTACGFVNATLESYSAVLQASLSYFTLLRTVGNTDEAEA